MLRFVSVALVAFVVVVSGMGCAECENFEDCEVGKFCTRDGRCQLLVPDAGQVDDPPPPPPPPHDAGMTLADAGRPDAGVVNTDAGFADAGTPNVDAGVVVQVDAGNVVTIDAGVVDAGITVADAGVPAPDAGAICGNGAIEPPEQCDDSNAIAKDGCTACVQDYCGDDIKNNAGAETCDDGNTTNNDGCNDTCHFEFCGDGVTQPPREECDDGENAPNDGCGPTCRFEYCGDGLTNDIVEECDDGNTSLGDGCTPACLLEFCGDGLVNVPGEDCDDGNTTAADGCSPTCHVEPCGTVPIGGVVPDFWIPPFSDIHIEGDIAYLAGTFRRIGPNTGSLLRTLPGGVDVDPTFLPQVHGAVADMTPDGSGGLYIVGTFDYVGNFARSGAAHLDTNGSVTEWDPVVFGYPTSVVLVGDTVYLGGQLTAVGLAVAHGVVGVDAITGARTGFSPSAEGIRQLVVDGDVLYVGGAFSTINGIARNNLAAFDLTTGLLTTFDPDVAKVGASSSVELMRRDATNLYIGGYIHEVGGNPRDGVASFDLATGALNAWAPTTDGSVLALAVANGIAYVGGDCARVNGVKDCRVEGFDVVTGTKTFDVGADDLVRTLSVDGDTIYAYGEYTTIGGASRDGVAAIDVPTEAVTSWSFPSDSAPWLIRRFGADFYVAGGFEVVGGVARDGLAALDLTTGRPTDWNPQVGGPGSDERPVSLAVDGDVVYVGGQVLPDFGGFGAAFDRATGATLPWSPLLDGPGSIYDLAVFDDRVFFTGVFDQVNLAPTSMLVAVDAIDGTTTLLDVAVDQYPRALLSADGVLYVGGTFTTLGGQPRANVGAIDPQTGEATAFNPSADGSVRSIASTGTKVYLGGQFTTIGGAARSWIAALAPASGAATIWNPQPSGGVFASTAVAFADGFVYAGGDFTSIGGRLRSAVAQLSPTNGVATTWAPAFQPAADYLSPSVSIIAPWNGHVILVGSFSQVNGSPAPGAVMICAH